ncbi:MAG: hypothetical protein P8129_03735 [Anaerolineae bacterium]
MLDDKMAVQGDGLCPGQGRIAGIQIAPAGLYKGQSLIGHQVGHGALEKIGPGAKVGVKDGDQVAPGLLQAMGQGAGLVTLPVGTMDQFDVEPTGPVVGHRGTGDARRLVAGVIQDLHLEQVAWIVEACDGVDQALDDVQLVVQGQLDRDRRPGKGLGRRGRVVMTTAEVQGCQKEGVSSI